MSFDSAIDSLILKGHQVRAFTLGDAPWFEIDGSLKANLKELLELGDGVYSVQELWELVCLRRREFSL